MATNEFDLIEQAAAPATPTPAEPSAAPLKSPKRGRVRGGLPLLLALTLAAGITGGAIGTLATSYSMDTNTAARFVSTRPITLESTPGATVASVVYGEVGPSVVEV